jgi:hypothetical protein
VLLRRSVTYVVMQVSMAGRIGFGANVNTFDKRLVGTVQCSIRQELQVTTPPLATGSGRQKLQHLHYKIRDVYPGAVIPNSVKGLPFGIRGDP